MSLRQQLEEIRDRQLIYPLQGKLVLEPSLTTLYPQIDQSKLCRLLADSLFYWDLAIENYLQDSWNKRQPQTPIMGDAEQT